MLRITLVGVAVVALLLACVLLAQPPLLLQDGVPVHLRLIRDVASAEVKVGDSVEFEVLEDVKVGDTVVIRHGGMAGAKIVEASRKKAGAIDIHLDYVQLINDDKISVRALRMAKTGRNADASFAPFAHGAEFNIPKGTEVTAYVHGAVTIDPARLAAKPEPAGPLLTPPSTVPPRPMTNADIIAMKDAGISDDLVMLKIKFSPGTYKIDADDIIALKQAHVSDPVIQTMLATAAPPAATDLPVDLETPPAAEAPRKGLLGKLRVAILGSPDPWSSRPPVHSSTPPEPPIPAQLALCPVTILSQPPDATILVDGYPAGRTPAVVRLQPGTYKVTLQAHGFPSYTQQIVVEAGQVRSFGVALDSSR